MGTGTDDHLNWLVANIGLVSHPQRNTDRNITCLKVC